MSRVQGFHLCLSILPTAFLPLLTAQAPPPGSGPPTKTWDSPPVVVPFEKVHPQLRLRFQLRPSVPVLIALADQPQRDIVARHTAAADLGLQLAESRYQQLVRRPFASEADLMAARDSLDGLIAEVRRNAFADIDAAIAPSQTEVEGLLRANGSRNIHRYSAINMLAAEIPLAALDALERSPLVSHVFPMESFRTRLDTSVAELGATSFWNAGWTGAGQSVAVMDTGVRTNHPAFAGKAINSQVFLSYAVSLDGACFADNASSGEDLDGHGTHVSGIVMSQGSTEGPNYRGVSRGLGTLYNLKVGYRVSVACGGGGSSWSGDVLAAMDWLLRNTSVRILNYSFGGASTADDSGYTRSVDQLVDIYGSLLTVAAGNVQPPATSCTTVDTPGNAYNILSVANWSVRGTISLSSCRGPTIGLRYKPDLAAPGTNITAPNYNWEASVDYATYSGTSMAAPHVAGSAALLRQAGVTNPLALKAVLLNTTDNTGWQNDRGWGYSNLNTALTEYTRYHTGSLTARSQPGSIKFYRANAPSLLKATITWNRHVPDVSSSVFHDVDLAAFRLSDGAFLSSSASVPQNVEQVAVNTTSDVVVKASMWSSALGGGITSEPYAVAMSKAFTPVNGPSLAPACNLPVNAAPGATFTVTCRVSNTGDLPAFGVTGQMVFPAGFSITGGYGFGTVQPGATSANVGATFTAPATPGPYTFRLDAASDSYGERFTGSVSFTVTVGQSCSYTLNPTSQSFGAGGGTGSVNVTAPVGCAWTAASNSGWVTVTGGTPGSGNGTVNYSVAVNAGASRSATITIGGQPFTVSQSGVPTQTGMRLVAVTPCRIMDTRDANLAAGFGPPFLTGGVSRSVPIPSSACGIPQAKAYSLNITVVPRGGPLGYLTVWPTGQPQPFVSTLNSGDGLVTANAAIVPAGTNGSISLFATHNTEVILDINGYFTDATGTDTLVFYPLTPCRVADTRNPSGTFGGPAIPGNSSRTFPVPSSPCGAPSAARAYALNVTVVPQGPLGYLTIWPAGQSQPWVSTLNAYDGLVVANAAIVPAGTAGAVSVFVSNSTHVILDINGYFAPPGAGGLHFYPVTPCRVSDTRDPNGTFGGPIITGGTSRSFPVPQSACGIPSAAAGYSLNATVVPSGSLGYLTVWPSGTSMPLASTLNAYDGLVTANAALVPAGAGGAVSVFGANSTHVILDIGGYFAP